MVIRPACASCGRCIGSLLLFSAAFQEIENEILGVVALRPHTNTHPFRDHRLLVHRKQVSRLLQRPEGVAAGGPMQVLSEVLAAVDLGNGLHLVATESGRDGRVQLDDGQVALHQAHWLQGLEGLQVQEGQIIDGIFLRPA